MPEHSPARRRALAALGLLAVSPLLPAAPEAKLRIVASNYPLAYFAERLVGSRASVSLPVPADEDPAYWRPSARAVGDMQRADLIVLNGADFEKWLPHVSLPRLKTVDTSARFKDAYIRIENAVTHSHGPGGEHTHAGTAYMTWLDFRQASLQAEALAEALVRKRPEWKSQIEGNLAGLKADLAGFDAELKRIAGARPGLPLLASHPVYPYLARAYGLNLRSVHWEPDEPPPAAEWAALKGLLSSHPAKWMIWEGEPAAESVTRLKTHGVGSLVFDPVANRPESGDFLEAMRANVERLKAAFR
jgi:zinc transport system substrate-binding protein